MSVERWLPVPGWEGLYEVSDLGRVRSLSRMVPGGMSGSRVSNGRILYPVESSGYPAVNLYSCARRTRHERVHVLVLEAFVGPRPAGAVCRHLNGDPLDNRLVNLAWGTQAQNAADRAAHGTMPRGESHYAHRLTERDVVEIRQLYAHGMRPTHIAKRYGVSRGAIRRAVTHRTWKHVGES